MHIIIKKKLTISRNTHHKHTQKVPKTGLVHRKRMLLPFLMLDSFVNHTMAIIAQRLSHNKLYNILQHAQGSQINIYKSHVYNQA